MKLAIVIAFASDQRSGRVFGGVVTADAAIKTVKNAIADGKAPDPRFPNLAAVALSDIIRRHRFQVTPAEIAEASKPVEAASGEVFLGDLIPVEIGEGEQMVIINVTTEDEAEFLKDLAAGAWRAVEEIKRLQNVMSDALKSHEIVIAAAKTELAEAQVQIEQMRNEKSAAEGLISGAGGEIERLRNEVGIANGAIDQLKSDIGQRDATLAERDTRISELETQLAEAIAKASKKK